MPTDQMHACCMRIHSTGTSTSAHLGICFGLREAQRRQQLVELLHVRQPALGAPVPQPLGGHPRQRHASVGVQAAAGQAPRGDLRLERAVAEDGARLHVQLPLPERREGARGRTPRRETSQRRHWILAHRGESP